MSFKDDIEEEIKKQSEDDSDESISDFRRIAKSINSVADAIQWLAAAVVFSGTLTMCSNLGK